MHAGRCNDLPTPSERMEAGLPAMWRVAGLPCTRKVKAAYIAGDFKVPRRCYSAWIEFFPTRLANDIRAVTIKVLWADTGRHARGLKCVDLLFTLVLQGQFLDPRQVWVYQLMMELRWYFSVNSADRACFAEEFDRQRSLTARGPPGPVACYRHALTQLGWFVTDSPFVILRPDAPLLHLFGDTASFFAHHVRDGIRRSRWKLERRRGRLREGLVGFETHEVEYDITTLLIRPKAGCAEERFIKAEVK